MSSVISSVPPDLILPPPFQQSFRARSYRSNDTPVGNAFLKWRTVARSSDERLISAMKSDSMSSSMSCVLAVRTFDTIRASAHRAHSLALPSLVSKTIRAASQAISRSLVERTFCISASARIEVVELIPSNPSMIVVFCRSFVRSLADLLRRRRALERMLSHIILSGVGEIDSRIRWTVPPPCGMNGQARAGQDRDLREKSPLPADPRHAPAYPGLRSG